MKNPAALHGLKRVFDHVIKRLLHLVAIDLDRRQRWIEVQLNDDVPNPDFWSQKCYGFLENLIQVVGLELCSRGTDCSQEMLDN